MPIIPRLRYENYRTETDSLAISTRAVIYIEIIDAATGLPTPGNGLPVTVENILNGLPGPRQTHHVIGTLLKLTDSVISVVDHQGNLLQSFDYQIVDYQPMQPDVPPVDDAFCDLFISSVTVVKKESAPGAADAQISIAATSSHAPIEYSLNGTNFQSSGIFTGLTGGQHTAYAKDGAGCTYAYGFNIDTGKSLLATDPSVDLGNGNISRWSAAFNPVVFTYQRKDFSVTGISADGNGRTLVTINANLSGLLSKDLIYLHAGAYNGVFEVAMITNSNTILIDTPFVPATSNTGFVNINRLRPYYQVQTQISYFDRDTLTFKTITSTNRPNNNGLVTADISSFLQSLLHAQDSSDYSETNHRDTNLCASYNISYAESWDGLQENQLIWIEITEPYYVMYAAKQLGDAYGGNLAAYVPFPTVNSSAKRARWVTDFTEPAFSNGYPFDIGFIYGEALAGLNIYCELTVLDINRRPITGTLQNSYLLNEDSSFLLNQDNGKLVIAYGSAGTSELAQHVGLNRLLVAQTFPPEAYYFTLTLKYDVAGDVTHTITQTQTVRIDDAVDDNSVYLRWIGLSGSWNYYRFVYNQEISLDVQNAVIIKNYVSDWANQDGIEQVISKQAGMKMKVMAEDLSVADIKGLQSIKYSPKVQMLVNKNPVKWQTVVLNTATFAEYETRNGQAPFSITFNLPAINVQSQ